jgi:hypothetical protein
VGFRYESGYELQTFSQEAYDGMGGTLHLHGLPVKYGSRRPDLCLMYTATIQYTTSNPTLVTSVVHEAYSATPKNLGKVMLTNRCVINGYGGPCVIISFDPLSQSGITMIFFSSKLYSGWQTTIDGATTFSDLLNGAIAGPVRFKIPFTTSSTITYIHVAGFLLNVNFPLLKSYSKLGEVVVLTGKVSGPPPNITGIFEKEG